MRLLSMTGSVASSTGSQQRLSSHRSSRLRKLSILSSSASQPGPLELLRDELIGSETAEQGCDDAELQQGGASSVRAGIHPVMDASGGDGYATLGLQLAHKSSAGSSPVEGTGRDSVAFSQNWGSDISGTHYPLADHAPAPGVLLSPGGARPVPLVDIASSAADLAAVQHQSSEASYDDGRLS